MLAFRLKRFSVTAVFSILAMACLCGAPVQAQTASRAASADLSVGSAGGQVFKKWCSDCHGAAEGPGSLALQRKYQGALPAVLEQRSNLPADYVKYVVRHGMSFMPTFRKTEISDAELALLAAYVARSQR